LGEVSQAPATTKATEEGAAPMNPFSKKRKFEEVSNTPKEGDLNKSSATSYYDANNNSSSHL
jgi:hypothetical protein